jgi:hypothetical protein
MDRKSTEPSEWLSTVLFMFKQLLLTYEFCNSKGKNA